MLDLWIVCLEAAFARQPGGPPGKENYGTKEDRT